ncbi:MAG: type II toxin-antitoxin system VapC family toxin [Pseudaminobacter sp.]|nr:type II toxin-antitoxin system VapC family toxin [Pseudaminobacter sp.]
MKVIADTNVLLRITTRDDPGQAHVAEDALKQATLVAITLPAVCELAWVLKRGYKQTSEQIARVIGGLLAISVVRIDRAPVEAGLAMLEAGGDFADGVIAYEGQRLGGETLLTFDRKAAALMIASGRAVTLLSARG